MGKMKYFLFLTLSKFSNRFQLSLVFFNLLQNSVVALIKRGVWLDNLSTSLTMLENNQITVVDIPGTRSLHRDWIQPLLVLLSVLVW